MIPLDFFYYIFLLFLISKVTLEAYIFFNWERFLFRISFFFIGLEGFG